MAVNRADLRAGIRDKISSWPDLVTTVAEALDATETGIDLTAADSVVGQSLIEVDSELMHVLSLSSLTATVYRGARGTTAATHSNGAVASIYPKWGWPSVALNRYITKAISWLGEGGVWTLIPTENTFLSGYREFGLPAGVSWPNGNHVKIIEVLQSDGTYKKTLGWKHQGDRIYLPSKLYETLSVRLWIQTKQPAISDDTTQLADDKFAEALELYSSARALEEMVANRTRYTDYSTALNDRASTPDELQRQAYFFMNQAVILRNEFSRPGLSGQANWPID